ncbi:diguanylate cyclase [Rheinheimera texasensis]|uniref:diguanylate cyclase n=1 Tax=Rheinheimera texasensis TaxID=306205 RepID=UPI0032B24730
MSEGLKAKIAELSQQYRSRLPQQFSQIVDIFQKLQERWNSYGNHELVSRLHVMKGSGGTFGLPQISDAATDLLQILQQEVSDAASFASAQVKLQQAMKQLERAIALSTAQVAPDNSVPTATTSEKAALIDRVLLLEDSDSHGYVLQTNLSEFGFAVDWVKTFKEAEQYLATQTPVIAIIDLNLPDGSRQQVFELVNGLHRRGSKAVIMTSENNFEVRMQAVRHQAAAFFNKPPKINELVAKIRHLLDMENARPYRILMVDDQQPVLSYYQALLEQDGFEFRGVMHPADLLTALDAYNPDLFILDYHLPDYNGAELAKLLRQIPEYEAVPILFMTAEQSALIKDDLVELGSDDVIPKNISSDSLLAQLNARVRRGRQLRQLMKQDSLTRLHNHGYIQELAQQLFVMAGRKQQSCSLIMLDIDEFKSVNDRFGHAVGDRVIVSLSQLLQQRLRKSDAIGRYGGEEFLVLMPDTEPAAALQVMQQILTQFGQIAFSEAKQMFSVTFSAGVAGSNDFGSAQAALDAADKTLYLAKTTGRNRVLLAEKPKAQP